MEHGPLCAVLPHLLYGFAGIAHICGMVICVVAAVLALCEDLRAGHVIAQHLVHSVLVDLPDGEDPAGSLEAARFQGRGLGDGEQDVAVGRRLDRKQVVVFGLDFQAHAAVFIVAPVLRRVLHGNGVQCLWCRAVDALSGVGFMERKADAQILKALEWNDIIAEAHKVRAIFVRRDS